MFPQLRPIVVSNRSFGKTSGTTIFVTVELQERLSGEGFQGVTLDGLETGRAFRGFKHLIEKVSSADGSLVLTFGETRREGSFYHVNLEEYLKRSQGRFYAMYREVGLSVSSTFLGENFPSVFEVEDREVLQNRINQVRRNPEEVFDLLAQKSGNLPALLNGMLSVLGSISGEQKMSKALTEGLEQLQGASNLVGYRRVVDQLQTRLSSRRVYSEAKGDDSWQKWIYRNSWLFGPTYLQPLQWQPVGLRSKPDFLFPTLDGFIDILEIKRPGDEVIRWAGNKYVWSGTTNHAIGQAVEYIRSAELNRFPLEMDINDKHGKQLDLRLRVARPRAFVLIGRDATWEGSKRESLRNLNNALHGVEVVTYDELLRRGRRMVGLYSQAPDQT